MPRFLQGYWRRFTPTIELNSLKLYRKGVDAKKFNEILYKDVFRFDGKYIQTWNLEESREKVKALKNFIDKIGEKEKEETIS